MKVVIVTAMPTPYRNPVFERLAKHLGDNLLVIFSCKAEPNRSWSFERLAFPHVFLKENIVGGTEGLSYIHHNPDVWRELKSFSPDVVISTGFYPTSLYAWAYALLFRKKHIPMTDGWLGVEAHLSWLHKLVRIIVFKTSKAFVGASDKSLELYRSYQISAEHLFKSPLCVENSMFKPLPFESRPYHIMFSGQFIERKMPLFFASVAKLLKNTIPELRVLILGAGPLEGPLLDELQEAGIDVTFPGFLQAEELAKAYASAKVFLFPTTLDAWGVVANEAMAAGTPVITSPNAGVAGDLVREGETGYVETTDASLWSARVAELLTNEPKWQAMSATAIAHVAQYTFDASAEGMLAAAEYARGD